MYLYQLIPAASRPRYSAGMDLWELDADGNLVPIAQDIGIEELARVIDQVVGESQRPRRPR